MIVNEGLKNKLNCFVVISTIITAALLFSFVGEVRKVDAQSPRVIQTYENDIYGFKLDYPPNWKFLERGIADESGEIIGNFRILGDFETPYIGILIRFLSPENATLQKYTQDALVRIKTSYYLGDKTEIISENQSAILGGQPAYEVIYSNIGELNHQKIMTVWTVLETEAYRLTFVAENSEEYDQYINTAKQIMNSFEFTR